MVENLELPVLFGECFVNHVSVVETLDIFVVLKHQQYLSTQRATKCDCTNCVSLPYFRTLIPLST